MVSIKNTQGQGEPHWWNAYCFAAVLLIRYCCVILWESSIKKVWISARSYRNSRANKHNDAQADPTTCANIFTCPACDDKTIAFVFSGKQGSAKWGFFLLACLFWCAYALNEHIACIFFRSKRT